MNIGITFFKMKLYHLQANYFAQSKVNPFSEEFRKLCLRERFITSRNFIIEIVLLFVSAYGCKSTFSTITLIKSKFKKLDFSVFIIKVINYHRAFD